MRVAAYAATSGYSPASAGIDVANESTFETRNLAVATPKRRRMVKGVLKRPRSSRALVSSFCRFPTARAAAADGIADDEGESFAFGVFFFFSAVALSLRRL